MRIFLIVVSFLAGLVGLLMSLCGGISFLALPFSKETVLAKLLALASIALGIVAIVASVKKIRAERRKDT